MPKNPVTETIHMIRRINDGKQVVRAPFKIVDGISCGNCKHFAAERCVSKRKPVKTYNICERHLQHEPKPPAVHL